MKLDLMFWIDRNLIDKVDVKVGVWEMIKIADCQIIDSRLHPFSRKDYFIFGDLKRYIHVVNIICIVNQGDKRVSQEFL